MPLQKSAEKLREAAEREAKDGIRRRTGSDAAERAQRDSDTKSAEAHPDIVKHEYSKAKPPRR